MAEVKKDEHGDIDEVFADGPVHIERIGPLMLSIVIGHGENAITLNVLANGDYTLNVVDVDEVFVSPSNTNRE